MNTTAEIRRGISSPSPINIPSFLIENKDIFLPIGIIGILIIMVIPIPKIMMDMLLVLSITSAILILMVAMYTIRPLDFSVFPSLLLIATLFRLSLNIASTRLILLYGNEGPDAAGKVIESFGNFVVGGSYVVGSVVFLILIVINFVVITKGAGRVAEVAARFTLDAMPGKQMAIDADLNAGLIDESQARMRRKKIEEEAEFYGAMDGASKFVRGDAIAGIFIVVINIVGGLIIGILQYKMDLSKAAQTYTILTIGDGLVSQIPSLLISTAAGIVVTKAASDTHISNVVASQLFLQPRALALTGGILGFMGLVPGLPTMPFLFFAGVMGGTGYLISRNRQSLIAQETMLEEKKREKALQDEEPKKVEELLPLDLVSIEVGYGLISLVDSAQKGDLLERIKSIRRQFALDTGFIVPPIHIRDNLELKPGDYSILIKGAEIASGELLTNHLLAMGVEGNENPLDGISTTEPVFGLSAFWISEHKKEQALSFGYTVVDLSTIIATHLTEILKQYSYELLTRQETQSLLDMLGDKYPKVVESFIPDTISLGAFQKVLQNLLKEKISIRDTLTIVETVSDYATSVKDTDQLTEYVRQALARTITKQFLYEDGKLYFLLLDEEVENNLIQAIKITERGAYFAVEPKFVQKLIQSLKKEIEKFVPLNAVPVLVCLPAIRFHLKKLIEKFIPTLAVLSHAEIAENTEIETVGIVRIKDEN